LPAFIFEKLGVKDFVLSPTDPLREEFYEGIEKD
jgi:hypothetical protein